MYPIIPERTQQKSSELQVVLALDFLQYLSTQSTAKCKRQLENSALLSLQ